MDFVVTLDKKPTGTVTVEYTTASDTADGGIDYDIVSGTVSFERGETSKIISVPIIDDTVNDSGERFEVLLKNAVGADIADDTPKCKRMAAGRRRRIGQRCRRTVSWLSYGGSVPLTQSNTKGRQPANPRVHDRKVRECRQGHKARAGSNR